MLKQLKYINIEPHYNECERMASLPPALFLYHSNPSR